jgi:MFS family permease
VANSPTSPTEQRVVWAFWLACVLAVLAGIAPFVFGGGSSRLGGAVFPFALAAIALGACALLYTQGRPIATALYFLASLAIVYGVLSMLAVPLRLAVLGTCDPEPAPCVAGLERPLTGAESTALGFAIGIGIVAILTGFFGLVTLYRRHRAPTPPPTPPTRRIAPVGDKAAPAAAAAVAAPPQASAPVPASEHEPIPVPEPELPAHVPDLELASPAELLELPAVGTEDAAQAAPPASQPKPKPRKRRAPKPPPDAPATTSTEAPA